MSPRPTSKSHSARVAWLAVIVVSLATVTTAAEIQSGQPPRPKACDGSTTSGQGSETAVAGEPVVLTVIQETMSVTESNGLIRVVGEVRNDGVDVVRPFRIEVAALDAAGTLLAAGTGSVYGAAPAEPGLGPYWDVLAPGAVGAFTAALSAEGGAVDAVLVAAAGVATEVEVAQSPLVSVTGWDIGQTHFGSALHSVVRNNGPVDVVGLRATVVVRDPGGTLRAVARAYPEWERIGGFLGGVRAWQESQVFVFLDLSPEELENAVLESWFDGQPYTGGRFSYAVLGVAHSPGANGAMWRSGLGLTNTSGTSGHVRLTYRAGGENFDTDLDLPDGRSVFMDDVVSSVFGISEPSAGYVQIESSVPLTVGGRTENLASGGSVGQSLPVITPTVTFESSVGPPGVLSPLRGGDRFRTNIGVVNLAGQPCAVDIHIHDDHGSVVAESEQIQLHATEWRQFNNVIPPGVEIASATVDADFGCPVTGYASVIEVTTGDPTTVPLGLQPEIFFGSYEPDPRGGLLVIPWADQD